MLAQQRRGTPHARALPVEPVGRADHAHVTGGVRDTLQLPVRDHLRVVRQRPEVLQALGLSAQQIEEVTGADRR